MTLRFKLLPLLLLLTLVAGPVSAAKIYTLRDANGKLVFSDRPVAGGEVIGVQQIELAKGPCFSVVKEGGDDDLQLQGVNDCYGPVEVEFTLDEADNVASDRPRRFTTVVGARKSQPIARLWQANRQRGYRYTFSHSFVIGDPGGRHLPAGPYLLPVPPGRSFRISQAFPGRATHTHPQGEYAVDIPLPEGTGIHAARAGIIMDVANDFFTGGQGEQFAEKANFIRILHEDGTMAIYAHLRLESIRYPVGTRVARGQLIAESGNTGYSSGPHLHFAIQRNFGMELRSVPFEFETFDGAAFTPETGMTVGR